VRSLPPIVLAALALAGCGADDADEAGSTAPPVTVTESFTVTEQPPTTPADTTPEGEGACSNSGLRLTLSEQDLPPVVADVRKRVFDAAVACDYDTLEQIAVEKGEGFTFSYGGERGAADYWRGVEEGSEEEPKPMRALATILTQPFTRNESGSYAWPTAYSESPTAEAWQALVDAGLYSQDQIEEMQGPASTGYLGYRTAITPDGQWQFFVAGD